MASEDKQALVDFAKQLNWAEHLDNPQILEHLQKIREIVNSKGSSSSKDVDVANSKRVKLVVVGDGAVGKTSLLIRFATGEFPTEYLPTVFENYTAQLKRENETILLHLWDTAGQEDYDRLRPLSYPGADVVLECFSTINQASYEAIREKWAPEIHHYIPNIPHILVGTKIDLRAAKHPDPNSGKYEPITSEMGQALANEIGAIKYLEICSKTGEGIQELFNEAVNQVLHERISAQAATANNNNNNNGKKKAPKKQGCVLL